MFKNITLIIIMLVFFSMMPGESAAADVLELNQLIEQGAVFDGTVVHVEGEALGEVMARGTHGWVNMSDPSNVMGIWMKLSDAERIQFFGNYKYRGDFIWVEGVFHEACIEHGGDTDIHALTVHVLKQGYPVDEDISQRKILVGIFLSLSTILVAYLFIKQMRVISL